MKKYVFLGRSIIGYTGAPRYINNKCRFLKEQGYEVCVFWCYGIGNVDLENLRPFDNEKYFFRELNYYPCWFSKRQQRNVCDKIIKEIGNSDEIIIESNNLKVGAWGEIIAKKLKAKHINFVISEHIRIKSIEMFNYCYFKLKRNEFFTINEPAVKFMFSNFKEIENAENYYWSASQGVNVKEYFFPAFDNLDNADYTICHFGRSKGYFPYMLSELKKFVSMYPEKTFNIFFIGDNFDRARICEMLSCNNLRVGFHPAVKIIPLQIFKKSDVIIATAGCAHLASYYGAKVISMDVNKNVPLGLMQYTTLDSNTDSGKYKNKKSLCEWLTTLLIEKEEFTRIDIEQMAHSFDYQMQFLTDPDGSYFDISTVKDPITRRDTLLIALTKIGLFCLVDSLFKSKEKKLYAIERYMKELVV